jgi:hypothetical protein
LPVGTDDKTSTPGAETLMLLPKFEKLARWLLLSTAATAITPGYAAG